MLFPRIEKNQIYAMKGVQCYELFGGIALKNHTFSFSFHVIKAIYNLIGHSIYKIVNLIVKIAQINGQIQGSSQLMQIE